MQIFVDESGDLGWTFNRPGGDGGSSRFITIAGIAIDQMHLKPFARQIHNLYLDLGMKLRVEKKGSQLLNREALAIAKYFKQLAIELPSFEMVSITCNKAKVAEPLRRDKNVFYNHLLSTLIVSLLDRFDTIDLVMDDRSIRHGSRNSFEDCLRAKCWGELGRDVQITCRYEDSRKNPGIWVADWLANFVWRHYENEMHDPYIECCTTNRYHEKTLFL